MSQPVASEDHELELLALVRAPELHVGDLVGPLPEPLGAVAGIETVQLGAQIALEELTHGLADPGRNVHAVGHGQDLLVAQALPGVVGGDAVQLADGVGGVGEAQRESGHVQLALVAVDASGQLQDPLDRNAARPLAPVAVVERPGDAPHEIRIEALVAGGDGGVDREDAVGAGSLQGLFQRHSLFDEGAGSLHEQERRVAFVEVPDRGLDAQRLDGPHAAGAQDQLLVEAHLAAADVEDVGDRPVRLVVVGNVRVEEEHGDAPHLGAPDRGREHPPRKLEVDGEGIAVRAHDAQDRQPVQVVVGVGVLLVPVGVDRLAEVAVLVEQPHADERQGHVARGLDVIAGQNAEAAGVDADTFVEAVLSAEVGDRALDRGAVFAVEPVLLAAGHVAIEIRQDLAAFGHECRVVEQIRPGDRLRQDLDRVAVAGERKAVDAAEKSTRPRVPAPPHVVGEPAQSL